VIFGHFFYFGHFPIEIPIEAEKIYQHGKELSYRENKICSETSEAMRTTWEYAQSDLKKLFRIRIPLLPIVSSTHDVYAGLKVFIIVLSFEMSNKLEKGDPVIIPNSTEKQKQPLRTVSGEDKFRSVFIVLPVHVGIISTNDFPSNIRYQNSK